MIAKLTSSERQNALILAVIVAFAGAAGSTWTNE